MSLKNLSVEMAVPETGLDVMSLVEYGSQAHGTSLDSSDRDLLGIYVEHDHELYGLEKAETRGYRLHGDGALEVMGIRHDDGRAAADDVEMHFHPLRKFVELAAKGNPTVLSTLWSTEALTVLDSDASVLLVTHRDLFLSKHVGFRHAGYARAQRDALLGRTNKRTNRPELISMHGYDTKHAGHLIRLLVAGLDFVRERTIHLPMKPEQVELIREIRRGEIAVDDLVALSEKLEHELTTETEDSNLPDSADYSAINDLLRLVRNEHLGR